MLSQLNFQHFKPTDAANKYLWLPASSEGKIVLTQYGQNNALPAELPTLETNRCDQQEPMLSASTTIHTQYSLNNALPAELPTLQTNRCGQQVPLLQHHLKGRLYSHSTVQTTISQQNLQHFNATDAHTCAANIF